MNTYKHLFFDLDNTITRSRSTIHSDLKKLLSEAEFDVIIVSGATCPQIATQVDRLPCFKLGQNGNHGLALDGSILWEEKLSQEEVSEVFAHIETIPRTWEVTDEADLVQDRKCQVSYSLLGHNEVLEKKEAFDPESSKRKELLSKYPFVSAELEVRIGGTTCLDYTKVGRHKGYYVAQLIERMGWSKDECAYYGDMLFEGGNDESVIGVIETVSVDNPKETLGKLTALSQ